MEDVQQADWREEEPPGQAVWEGPEGSAVELDRSARSSQCRDGSRSTMGSVDVEMQLAQRRCLTVDGGKR